MALTKVKASARHMKRSMERAIRGNPIRALAELISNADDSYRRLEDAGAIVSGRIEIELDRRYSNSTVVVRDFAEGMSRRDAVSNMTDWGGAQSGQSTGGSARGFFGRGAKDALIMMEYGRLATIKDGKLTTLDFIRDGRDGHPDVDDHEMAATPGERKTLGVLRGNGTVVSFQIESGTPQFDKLREALTSFYMLRRLNSDPARSVVLINKGREVPLKYQPPLGEEISVAKRALKINNIEFELSASVYLAATELDQVPSDRREGGILVLDEYDSALDLSLFKFDNDPDATRLFGEVEIKGLRSALLKDENIVTEERDGLNRTNATAQAIIREIESILEPIVKAEREKNARAARKLSSTSQKRVNSMLDELNKLAAEFTGLGTSAGPKKTKSAGNGAPTSEPAAVKPDTIAFIPNSVTLTPGIPETVSAYINTKRCSGEVIVYTEADDVDVSPEDFVIDSAVEVYRRDIHLRCDVAGKEGTVVLVSDAAEADFKFRVIDVPYPNPTGGLEFVPSTKDIRVGRSRTLDLYADISTVPAHTSILIEVDDTSVADVDTTSVRVDPSTARGGIVHLQVKVVGRQIGGKANVVATAGSVTAVCEINVRSRKAKERDSGGLFAGLDWDDRKFPKCTFRADDEFIVVHTQEPSFAYLGVTEKSFDGDRAVQVAVAEACTQVACARIAEKSVPGQGKRPWYLSSDAIKRMQEDRVFTESLTRFVGPVIYRHLVQAPNRRQLEVPGAPHSAADSETMASSGAEAEKNK